MSSDHYSGSVYARAIQLILNRFSELLNVNSMTQLLCSLCSTVYGCLWINSSSPLIMLLLLTVRVTCQCCHRSLLSFFLSIKQYFERGPRTPCHFFGFSGLGRTQINSQFQHNNGPKKKQVTCWRRKSDKCQNVSSILYQL